MKYVLSFLLVTTLFSSCVKKEKEYVPVQVSTSTTPVTLSEDDDGGWSSSGGGDFIVDKNNPWFMGWEPVKWCINHGGEDQFSLPLEKAKRDIQLAIDSLSKQLIKANNSRALVPGAMMMGQSKQLLCSLVWNEDERVNGWERKCNSFGEQDLRGDPNRKRISDTFEYVENCSNAELEFLLGNIKDFKFQKLLRKYGKEKMEKVVATAMRTDYDFRTLRGKGFIYIAADKGDFQYRGDRNVNGTFNVKTIWNKVEEMSPEVLIPHDRLREEFDVGALKDNKLKNHVVTALTLTAAHELGHVIGFEHTETGLMNAHTPSKAASVGFVSQLNYEFLDQLLSLSLYKMPKLMGYRIPGQLIGFNGRNWGYNQDQGPIVEFLMRPTNDNRSWYTAQTKDLRGTSIALETNFERGEIEGSFGTGGRLLFLNVDPTNLEYVLQKSFEIKFQGPCDLISRQNNVSVIYKNKKLTKQRIFNQESGLWEQKEVLTEFRRNVSVLDRAEKNLCGVISLDSGEELAFEIKHGLNSVHKLVLKDKDNDREISIDLFGASFKNYESHELPKPKLWFSL